MKIQSTYSLIGPIRIIPLQTLRVFTVAVITLLFVTSTDLFGQFTQNAPASGTTQKMLNGHVPLAAKRLTPIGLLPGSNQLDLAIGLPVRSQDGLNTFLQQLYDPTSPKYRQYVTPELFTEMFGPTQEDYQAVIAFAKSQGLTITATHPNRIVLDVTGTAADIQKAFHVTVRVYQHPTEARTFYAPDAEPSVDAALPILNVSGLDNYSLRHPNSKIKPANLSDNVTSNSGSGPSGTYRGNDFRAAYIPGVSLTGSGQTVGLLQFDGYYANDIAMYESQAGLPSVPLTNIAVDGGVTVPGSDNVEVCLDIEMVISMAPGLSRIYVYEAPNPSLWEDLLSRVANDNLAKQLSCSWSGGPPNATAEQIFQQMAAQGQTFFVASGDSDALTGSIPFPCDSPNIVVVGGTTLNTTGPGGALVSETVWNWGYLTSTDSYWGSSGGISSSYSIPAHQQGISMTANQGSTVMRNIPDVALTADNVYVVYDNGSSGPFGGTSCAAPLWAGFTALVNQRAATNGQSPVGFLNPALYAIGKRSNYASDFHDTATGDNEWPNSPSQFSAVAGYDLCTGWGTPNGANLIAALTTSPTDTFSASVIGNSRSIFMDTCSGFVPGLGQLDNYVTTYDGQTGFPLYQMLPDDSILFSGELRPRFGQSGVYEADFVTYDDQGDLQDYGSFTANLPTTDLDRNGLPDVAQKDRAGNANVSGTAVSDYYGTISSITGSLLREANSPTGSYSVTLSAPGSPSINYNGSLYLFSVSGNITYSRASGSMNLSLIETLPYDGSRILSGSTYFNVVNVNQVILQQFSLSSSDGNTYTVSTTTFNRVGNKYTANVQLADGLPETYWPDYVNWVVEITDPNDSDGNGIPNLSDGQSIPTPSTPTIMPNGARFKKKVVVTLACATSGATIYYTTDGSDPTRSSTQGTQFILARSAVVKAMAVETGLDDSAVASAQFTKGEKKKHHHH